MPVIDMVYLTRPLWLLARPVMITHPRERKDICPGRKARFSGVLLHCAGRRGSGMVWGTIMQGNALVTGQQVPAGKRGSAPADEGLLLCVWGCQLKLMQHA